MFILGDIFFKVELPFNSYTLVKRKKTFVIESNTVNKRLSNEL